MVRKDCGLKPHIGEIRKKKSLKLSCHRGWTVIGTVSILQFRSRPFLIGSGQKFPPVNSSKKTQLRSRLLRGPSSDAWRVPYPSITTNGTKTLSSTLSTTD